MKLLRSKLIYCSVDECLAYATSGANQQVQIKPFVFVTRLHKTPDRQGQ